MRVLATVAVLAWALPALAEPPDDDPPSPADAPIAPTTPMPDPQNSDARIYLLDVALTGEISLFKGNAGDPISIAPDIQLIASGLPELNLEHSSEALTGFQGLLLGTSLCVAGDVCKVYSPHVYHTVGLEVGKVIRSHLSAEGELNHAALAVDGGLVAYDFDPFNLAVKLGARASYVTNDLMQVQLVPNVHISLTERDLFGDRYYVPLKLAALPSEKFSLEFTTGIAGAFQNIGSTWQIPLGIAVDVTVTKDIGIEVGFMFPAVEGGDAIGVDGFDARVLTVGLDYTKLLGAGE